LSRDGLVGGGAALSDVVAVCLLATSRGDLLRGLAAAARLLAALAGLVVSSGMLVAVLSLILVTGLSACDALPLMLIACFALLALLAVFVFVLVNLLFAVAVSAAAAVVVVIVAAAAATLHQTLSKLDHPLP